MEHSLYSPNFLTDAQMVIIFEILFNFGLMSVISLKQNSLYFDIQDSVWVFSFNNLFLNEKFQVV